jgi:cytochrome c oxidase subunit 1
MQPEQTQLDTEQTPEDHFAATPPEMPASETEEHVEHIHLPPPTIWPITMAGGISLGFLGLVTNEFMSVLGVLLAAYGLVNWVQELRHEPR